MSVWWAMFCVFRVLLIVATAILFLMNLGQYVYRTIKIWRGETDFWGLLICWKSEPWGADPALVQSRELSEWFGVSYFVIILFHALRHESVWLSLVSWLAYIATIVFWLGLVATLLVRRDRMQFWYAVQDRAKICLKKSDLFFGVALLVVIGASIVLSLTEFWLGLSCDWA